MNNLKNSVRLIGHLGSDPEKKETSNGKTVIRFSLATNEFHKDEKGNKLEETTWHNLTMWGGHAETMVKYLKKGKEVAIEGRISNRQYTDNDGVKKTYSEVIVNDIMMLGPIKKEA